MSEGINDLKRFRDQWINELSCENVDEKSKTAKHDESVDVVELVTAVTKSTQKAVNPIQHRENEDLKSVSDRLHHNYSSSNILPEPESHESKDNLDKPKKNLKKQEKIYNSFGSSSNRRRATNYKKEISSTAHANNETIPAFEIINSCFRNANYSDDGPTEILDGVCSTKQTEIKSENYLDLLISDIDEITGLPFFDLELPKEIALRIFYFLSIKDLVNCCYVNKSWKSLAEDDLLWFYICKEIDIETNVQTSAEGCDWKDFAAKATSKRRTLEQNWRERKCAMVQLNYEQGGILCAASQYEGHVIAGYLNGTVLLWDTKKDCKRTVLNNECHGNSVEEKCEKIVIDTACDNDLCAASFASGTITIWQMLTDYNNPSIVHERKLPTTQHSKLKLCNDSLYGTPMLMALTDKSICVDVAEGVGSWKNIFTKTSCSKISFVDRISKDKLLIANADSLEIVGVDSTVELERSIGAIIKSTDIKQGTAACALHYKGFHVLGGFRIKIFDISSCKLSQVLLGPLCSVSCLNLKNSPDNYIVAGCSDYKIRIFDMRIEKPICSFYGQRSQLTTIQMDDVKVVSGAINGSVCVWDRRMTTTHLWENQLKHPIRLCQFTDKHLFIAAVPSDQNPQESMWYIDDLMQHRRLRGSVSVFDFDVVHGTENIPEICQSTYDDMTGYDYNITLVTPFDDVLADNLPQM